MPARGGKGFEYDVRFTWPSGDSIRERGRCPSRTKTDAHRWAEARERVIAAFPTKADYRPLRAPVRQAGPTTFSEFWPRVLRDHYQANRKKASTIDAVETIWRVHLEPAVGTKRLAEVTSSDVAELKGKLQSRSPKTVNNVLVVLSRMLRCAVDWGILTAMPCKIVLLKVPPSKRGWYEVHEYRRLVEGARKAGPNVHLLVLLAGSAGLRRGEIIALKWTDVDLERGLLHVDRAMWKQVEDAPKGWRGRVVPMTPELAEALKAYRHLGERVLFREDGHILTKSAVCSWMKRAQKRGGLEDNGAIHVLRHTFCSHLAIAGVPAKAIQELAGHADLGTTQRYMHLAPGDRNAAMGVLSRLYESDQGMKEAV